MRTYSRPALVALDPAWSLNSLLRHRIDTAPQSVISEVQRDGGWAPVTARQFGEQVDAVAKGFIASGLRPGAIVAVMSRTRYEWMLLDFAIWAAGCVSVPIYETSSPDQVRWICADADVNAIVVETLAHLQTVELAAEDLPELGPRWVIDKDGIDQLVEAGRAISDDELAARRNGPVLADLASIIYTSGTTGRPKGVELTHENFVFISANVSRDLEVVCRPGTRLLLFLPLAHVFARVIQVLAIGSGSLIGHHPDTSTLVEAMQSFKPTYIIAVPRVFEKMYNVAEQSAGGSGTKLKIFRWAAKVAITYSRSLDTAKGPSPFLKAQHTIADRLVYAKIRHTLGDALQFSYSAGAPLGERLGHFYRGVGLRVIEGYGLTETAGPVAANRPETNKIGTVGQVIPGTDLMVDDSGEILSRGQHVFRAYHNNPEATAATFHDDWFRTGDIGTFDDDGFLRITGRMKELIVTAAGKNVAPAVLEDRLRGHPLVSQCVVVGDGRQFIGALLTLDPEMLPGWLANHNLPQITIDEARHDPNVLASLQRAVDRANRAVSRAESIRKWIIIPGDFTEANGYLTPSLKVKRALVLHDYAGAIDELYANGDGNGHGNGHGHKHSNGHGNGHGHGHQVADGSH